jgi:Putative neutral zinc metallopeptidase
MATTLGERAPPASRCADERPDDQGRFGGSAAPGVRIPSPSCRMAGCEVFSGMGRTGEDLALVHSSSAVGDDRLPMQARGYVVPESFTHGSAAERVRWFRRGLATGEVRDGDAFNARRL